MYTLHAFISHLDCVYQRTNFICREWNHFFLLLLLSNLTGKISSYRLHANLISTTEKRLFRNVVKENENRLHAKFVSVIFLPHNQFASIILFFCRENEMLNLLCINRRWKNKLKNCSDKPYSVMFFLFFFTMWLRVFLLT